MHDCNYTGFDVLRACHEIRKADLGYTRRVTSQTRKRPGRNEPCYCGSGRKYKQCCLEKDEAAAASTRAKNAPEASPQATTAAPPAPTGAQKPRTAQPWKASASRGFVPRSRTPRKVGGSWAPAAGIEPIVALRGWFGPRRDWHASRKGV